MTGRTDDIRGELLNTSPCRGNLHNKVHLHGNCVASRTIPVNEENPTKMSNICINARNVGFGNYYLFRKYGKLAF